MLELFDRSAFNTGREITHLYSTSFGKGILALDKRFHDPIYGIYGFVRYADEIVDTFFHVDQRTLLLEFMDDTKRAIERKISLNPVLHAFQKTVHDYGIEEELINAFFKSMYMDLDQKKYEEDYYNEYIYGSAEVVGLMCLKVFTEGNFELYESLKMYARSLGAAFQKVNFLRDVQSDFEERGRVYFPGVDFRAFTEEKKRKIEAEILQDFIMAYEGILKLPRGARGGVYLAYKYYLALFKKIRRVEASRILKERIRVPDNHKVLIMAEIYLRTRLNVF